MSMKNHKVSYLELLLLCLHNHSALFIYTYLSINIHIYIKIFKCITEVELKKYIKIGITCIVIIVYIQLKSHCNELDESFYFNALCIDFFFFSYEHISSNKINDLFYVVENYE